MTAKTWPLVKLDSAEKILIGKLHLCGPGLNVSHVNGEGGMAFPPGDQAGLVQFLIALKLLGHDPAVIEGLIQKITQAAAGNNNPDHDPRALEALADEAVWSLPGLDEEFEENPLLDKHKPFANPEAAAEASSKIGYQALAHAFDPKGFPLED